MSNVQTTLIKGLVETLAANADKLTKLVIALALLAGFVAVIVFLWRGAK